MNRLAFLTMCAVAAASLRAEAATITSADLGQLGIMPGSLVDYNFLPPGGSQPTDLTHFSGPTIPTHAAAGVSEWGPGGGGAGYSTILSPAGASMNTGIVYTDGGPGPDLVQYALVPALNSAPFNYSNFNVYFMYGNTSDPGPRDGTVTLTLLAPDDITVLTSETVNVTDLAAVDHSKAQFEQFTVVGAAAGDILQFGAVNQPDSTGGYQSYVGGVSFEANVVPEPGTWAMLLGGLGMLVFVRRLRGPLVR